MQKWAQRDNMTCLYGSKTKLTVTNLINISPGSLYDKTLIVE